MTMSVSVADKFRRAAAPAAFSATPSALQQILRHRPVTPGPTFQPLPAPVGRAPYRRRLADVLTAAQLEAIEQTGELRFHCVGDTGGWRDPRPQRHVAAAMVDELDGPAPVDFFYHLGDVIYPHGEEANYGAQFFSPYAAYDAPIFAIPGNHDGEAVRSRTSSLEPFVKTFCSSAPRLHDAAITVRWPPSHQPHVFWTLVHDWMWVIGVYSNVHEDGEIAEDQLEWMTGELRAAPRDAIVILAVHRPVFSIDAVHGSNLALRDAFDECFSRAGRVPDAVFGAHAHDYQRFTRRHGERQIPYVVAGSGGFHERHEVGTGVLRVPASFPGLPDLTLEAYESERHGFMTVTVRRQGANVVYNVVSNQGTRQVDSFRIAPTTAT
jgi:acid phosphatase type 7